MPEHLMSPEQAERCIWGFYWQLDNSRDRRNAPVNTGPPTKLEATIQQQEQLEAERGLWTNVRKQVERWFTRQKQEEHLAGALEEARNEVAQREHDVPGKLNVRTGLPEHANDLAVGRGVLYGYKLCREVILPPAELAASCTAWLPPCPGGYPEKEWGQKEEHWQVLAYKRREEWTEEECRTVDHNELQIKRKVHKLAEEHGYFDLRPLNDRDPELYDLVWQDEAGHTLGFRITYKGYQAMHEYCEHDPELRRTIHLLTYAGEELRKQAPQWAQAEYDHANK